MATLTFTLALDGMEEDTLVVREYQGHESISDSLLKDGSPCYGFRYQLALASRQSDLSADTIVDKNAELRLFRNGELVQRVHGIVRHFEKGDTGHNFTYYGLTLVPALERLSLRHNSRIFQKQTAQAIITQLLDEMGITEHLFDTQRTPLEREFCVQYRETDLEFLHRLAAEEGWVYYFTHEEGKHLLHFADQSQTLPKYPSTIPYNVLSGGGSDDLYISTLTHHTQSYPSQAVLKDYSFKKPDYRFLHQQDGENMDYQLPTYEHFDAPGRFKDDVTGKAFSRIRLEYLRRSARTLVGESNHAGIQAGMKITLEGHTEDSINQEWLPVSVEHHGTQPQVLEEEGQSGSTSYSNRFTFIPAITNWQGTPQPKPSVDGPMMATVVGPEGEEIFCDEHGRVKLHFPWDRYSEANDHSSCWVRVSQGWAGNQHGMMAIPRIGSEVIVSFLNGDPDQPIVTGRTFNAKNTPPYLLPDNKTKTVWRSDTHQGEGFNEISFEDQVDNEKVYVHAQKDHETDVLNDSITHIGNDQHRQIDNDRFTQLNNNDHLTVKGESRHKIDKDHTLTIDGSLQQKVGKIAVLEAGEEIHFKSGDKTVIEAGAEITLAAGGSFVKIDGGGVHMVGAAINLNAGGSPSAGSGFTGELPANAKTLTSESKEHYLEIFHLDSELQPIKNAKYTAILSDGTEIKGVLDGDGYAKINDVSNGVATVYYETEQPFADVPREAIGGVVSRLDSLLGE